MVTIRKWLILVSGIMFALKLMVGCGGGDIETYSAAELVINIGINKQFAIDLGSNPTTGHGLQ